MRLSVKPRNKTDAHRKYQVETLCRISFRSSEQILNAESVALLRDRAYVHANGVHGRAEIPSARAASTCACVQGVSNADSG